MAGARTVRRVIPAGERINRHGVSEKNGNASTCLAMTRSNLHGSIGKPRSLTGPRDYCFKLPASALGCVSSTLVPGLGHVARIVGEIVGPTGAVVGIDRSGEALAIARRRVEEAGVRHVSFQEGDVTTWRAHTSFDAIVGRLVLFHLGDQVVQRCVSTRRTSEKVVSSSRSTSTSGALARNLESKSLKRRSGRSCKRSRLPAPRRESGLDSE